MSEVFLRGYKAELAPNNRQQTYFGRCAGTARFVYNWALADRKAMREADEKCSCYDQRKRFNAIKDVEFPWVREVPYAVAEAAFADLDAAYQNFFRRVRQGAEKKGFPKFKSRNNDGGFALRSTKVQHDRVRLTRIGWVRLKERWYLPRDTELTTYARISERAGRWYISVQAKDALPSPNGNDGIIGVDLGLNHCAVLSNGDVLDIPGAFRKYERKISRLEREKSRRKKGSQNRRKTKIRLARAHAKIADVRRYWQHHVTNHIINLQPSIIVLENLNVAGMLKNRHLAKSIADVGFGEIRRQIEYKAQRRGIQVIIADRWFASSKICSSCGHKKDSLKLSTRTYRCSSCGVTIDRDYNAALNLAALVNRETHGDCLVS